MAPYNAKFKTQENCSSDVGQRELKSYCYKSYRTCAVKSSSKYTNGKWKVTTRIVDERDFTSTISGMEVEINLNNYETIGDFQTLKAYFKPLILKHAGSFSQTVKVIFMLSWNV